MQIFEFNTDKMTWAKYNNSNSQYNTCGMFITFTDADYFNQVKHIFQSLITNKGKLVLIDHTNTRTYFPVLQKIERYDAINNEFKSGTTKDNFRLEILMRDVASNWGDLNTYWLYIVYE